MISISQCLNMSIHVTNKKNLMKNELFPHEKEKM
jgi:hypothetical protein